MSRSPRPATHRRSSASDAGRREAGVAAPPAGMGASAPADRDASYATACTTGFGERNRSGQEQGNHAHECASGLARHLSCCRRLRDVLKSSHSRHGTYVQLGAGQPDRKLDRLGRRLRVCDLARQPRRRAPAASRRAAPRAARPPRRGRSPTACPTRRRPPPPRRRRRPRRGCGRGRARSRSSRRTYSVARRAIGARQQADDGPAGLAARPARRPPSRRMLPPVTSVKPGPRQARARPRSASAAVSSSQRPGPITAA